jgi:hypothetical protein
VKFRYPLESENDVAWTKTNEFFHAYTAEQIAQKQVALSQGGIDPTNEYPWVSRGATLAIPGNIQTNSPLLLADNYRNLLIFQNNSIATSPDVAPNLFIALDGPVQTVTFTNPVTSVKSTLTYNAITLVPGEGLLLDTRILTNAIYVAWGTSVNTGGTVFTIGALVYGRTANSPPLSPYSQGISASLGGNDPGNAGSPVPGKWVQ